MFALVIDFANMLLAALLVGALFGAWLFLNPKGVKANAYVTVQQQAIRTMNGVMPALGVATVLVTLVAAALGRDDHRRLWLLAGAALCFVTIGLITRFLNQPINAVVMTWGDLPPENWMDMRDAWWRWHGMRLLLGIVGLSLLIVSMLRQGWNG